MISSMCTFIDFNPDDARYYNKDCVKEIAGTGIKGKDHLVNGTTLKCCLMMGAYFVSIR
jgi:hypothetical protein